MKKVKTLQTEWDNEFGLLLTLTQDTDGATIEISKPSELISITEDEVDDLIEFLKELKEML